MKAEAFEARVKRLEVWAKASPRLYRLGVVAWALLGYAVIFLFLLFAVAMVGLLVLAVLSGRILFFLKAGFQALFVLVPLIWVLLRSLLVRLPPPSGVVLLRHRHRRLFALIDEVRAPLGVRAPDQVLLQTDLNAAVAELPRLGLLPWFRSYLLIGMPLLRAVSPEELRAILAHEFGHLSGAHGRLGSWIYRVRRTWEQVVARIAQGEAGGGGGLLVRFFFWYVPRFSAWSFTLARANEYEADQASAQLTSLRTAADALVRVDIASHAEEQFWASLDRSILEDPQPPADLFKRLGSALHSASRARESEGWLTRALGRRTSADDTHPALVDRLRALAQKPRVPPPLEQDAASALLGEAAASALEARLSREWSGKVTPAWSERRRMLLAMQGRLAALDAAVAGGSRAGSVLRERAALIGALRDEHEALSAWRVVLRLEPTDNLARYHVGRLILAAPEAPPEATDEAVTQLTTVADSDPNALIPVAEVLVPWLRAHHRESEAAAWLSRARAHLGAVEAIRAERGSLSAQDALLPANLPDSVRASLAAQINTTDGVAGAWVARKALSRSQEPLFILGVQLALVGGNTAAAREAREVRWQLLVDDFQAPGEWLLVPLHHSDAIRRKMEALPDAALPC